MARSPGDPLSFVERLFLVMHDSRKSKGKARATTPSPPPQAGPSIASFSEATAVALGSLQSGFLVESSSNGDLYAVDGSHELKMVVTTFRTLFEGNKGE